MSETDTDITQQQKMWHDFVRIVTWSCIASAVVLALMAAFLT